MNQDMHSRIAPLLLLLCAPLQGCLVDRTVTNQPLPREKVAAFEPGKTSARDVVAALGAPVEVVQLGRRTAYRYEFNVSKRAGLWLIVIILVNRDTRSDRVWVFFDEHDVLTHVGVTYEGDRPEYALPWEDLHE